MKLFGHSKEKTENAGARRCEHPVRYQIPVYENPSSPRRITGFKCTHCGQKVYTADKPAA